MQEGQIIEADVVIIGGGPGGYPCAFRAADLGLDVLLIDDRPSLGGVCLHEGCMPTKAWLNAVKVYQDMKAYEAKGLMRGELPSLDPKAFAAWVDEAVKASLGRGLDGLSRRRNRLRTLKGTAQFMDSHRLRVTSEGVSRWVHAQRIVVATGSEPIRLPTLPEDPRIFTSSEAFSWLKEGQQGKRILLLGAGIIGCEFSGLLAALGYEVIVCDRESRVLNLLDAEIGQAIQASLEKQGVRFKLGCDYQSVDVGDAGLRVHYTHQGRLDSCEVDGLFVAIGRRARVKDLNLECLPLSLLDARGHIKVNARFQTAMEHIYAVGDVIGGQVAHQASAEGRICAEILAGRPWEADIRAVPGVVYTYPEAAWIGSSEEQLKAQGIDYRVAHIPWRVNGRALVSLHTDGFTKLIADPQGRVLGGAVVGVQAGDLISELSLALEMGADVEDLALTVRAHPTTSEVWSMAAEHLESLCS